MPVAGVWTHPRLPPYTCIRFLVVDRFFYPEQFMIGNLNHGRVFLAKPIPMRVFELVPVVTDLHSFQISGFPTSLLLCESAIHPFIRHRSVFLFRKLLEAARRGMSSRGVSSFLLPLLRSIGDHLVHEMSSDAFSIGIRDVGGFDES